MKYFRKLKNVPLNGTILCSDFAKNVQFNYEYCFYCKCIISSLFGEMFVVKWNSLCLLRVYNLQGINDAIIYTHSYITKNMEQSYLLYHIWTLNTCTMHTRCSRYAWMVLKQLGSQMESKTKFSSDKWRTASPLFFIHLANSYRCVVCPYFIFHVSCYKTIHWNILLILLFYYQCTMEWWRESIFSKFLQSSFPSITFDVHTTYSFRAQIILAYQIQKNLKWLKLYIAQYTKNECWKLLNNALNSTM